MIDAEYEHWRETVNALFAACVQADVIPAKPVLAWFRQTVEDARTNHAEARPPVLSTEPFRIKRRDGDSPTRRFT